MYGGETNVESNNEQKPSLFENYQKAKFTMTWDAYIEAKRDRGLERARLGTLSNQSEAADTGMQSLEPEIAEDMLGAWAASGGQ